MLCQESQLDLPVKSTRTKTRRLQSLLLGTRRLQSPAVVDQEAAESPAAGGQETAAAESPDVGQEAAVSPAAADQ